MTAKAKNTGLPVTPTGLLFALLRCSLWKAFLMSTP